MSLVRHHVTAVPLRPASEKTEAGLMHFLNSTRRTLTRHARIRMQQRGLTNELLTALLAYGQEIRARNGWKIFFDKRSTQRARQFGDFASVKLIEEHHDAYAIESDNGRICTVGIRTHRIQHKRKNH